MMVLTTSISVISGYHCQKHLQNVLDVWNDVRKGIKVILWCNGLKGSNSMTTNPRKQSKKKTYSDEEVTVTSRWSANKKKSD